MIGAPAVGSIWSAEIMQHYAALRLCQSVDMPVNIDTRFERSKAKAVWIAIGEPDELGAMRPTEPCSDFVDQGAVDPFAREGPELSSIAAGEASRRFDECQQSSGPGIWVIIVAFREALSYGDSLANVSDDQIFVLHQTADCRT